jgi:hypothetical protein
MTTSHPDAVFGSDTAPPVTRRKITYREVAGYLEDLDTRALTSDDAGDVLDLLDYMHEHTLKLIAQNDDYARKLNEREAAISRREADLALRQRAVDSILKVHPAAPKRRYFWSK